MCFSKWAQHALFQLIETCRKTLDEKRVVGMVLMDLSKAYDCLPHELLLHVTTLRREWKEIEENRTISWDNMKNL